MMMKQLMMCAEANNIDIVDFLLQVGHSPHHIRGGDYWYLSPLRVEKTPSFKVARKRNLWYDHGIGKGGNLVDFGVLFYGCSVREFLQKLTPSSGHVLSFQPPPSIYQTAGGTEEKKLVVTDVKPVSSPRLFYYLSLRKIDLTIAEHYLREISFSLNGKPFIALGFKNNSGGFELRNDHFKGSSSPKNVTLIDNNEQSIAVFEGCFSFLSYLSLPPQLTQENCAYLPERQPNFLILNSLAFFEKSRPVMEGHAAVNLYLDRDAAGQKATEQALHWSQKYKDKSLLYNGHKDLNEFLKHHVKAGQRQSLRRGRHF